MDVVDPGLKPNGPNARQAPYFASLLVPEVAAIHHPAIGLLNPVPVDGIIGEEREIREEIQPIVLVIRIGKKLTAQCRIVMAVQLGGAAERLAPF